MWGISRSCASERPFGFSAFQRAPCSLARVFCVRSFILFFLFWGERSRGAPRGWCRALSGRVHDADLERLLADRDFCLRRPSPLGGCNVDRISQRALRDDVSSFFSGAGACVVPCQGGVRSARGQWTGRGLSMGRLKTRMASHPAFAKPRSASIRIGLIRG